MTIEKWVHKIWNGIEEAYIKYDGIEYTVCGYYLGRPILFNTYKTYTWARKSLEKYGFVLESSKIILGA